MMSEVPLQHETSVEESTAEPTADVPGFLGQDVLAAMDRLSSALKAASGRVSNQQAQGGQKSEVGGHSSNSRKMEAMYKKEGERLKKLNETTSEGGNSENLGYIADKFIFFPLSWTYQGPVFRFRLRPW